MILKKVCLSYFEILEICGFVSHEEYAQDEPLHELKHRILKTKKPNNITSMLTQDRKILSQKRKKIMTEKKTTLLFIRNQDFKKGKVETWPSRLRQQNTSTTSLQRGKSPN